MKDFNSNKVHYISWEDNVKADLLSKLASSKKLSHLKMIIQETLHDPTIEGDEVMLGDEE